jgi:putative two-component system response regulator
MRTHAVVGARILSGGSSRLVRLAEEMALTHHERWDGEGYPQRLAGEAIPLGGRLVAVADVFDALINPRPYKAAWPVDRAVATMRSERGRHFDPQLLDLFLAELPSQDPGA